MATQFPRMFQYQPIYKGIPIESVARDLELRAKAYETNLDKYNKVMEYASTIRALPGDQEYLSQVFKAADEQIKHIADKTHGSQRWDVANSAINRMAAKFTQDPTIVAIQESYKNFQEGEKLKMELSAKGATPLEFSDFTNHRTVKPDGSIDIYRPDIQPQANYVAEAAKLWGALEPEITSLGLTRSEFQGILEGKVIKGITKDRILRTLDNVYNVYKESDSGKQQHRLLRKEGVENPEQAVKDFILGIGMLREHTQEQTTYQEDYMTKLMLQARLAQEKAERTEAVRKATGRPNYESATDDLLKKEDLVYTKNTSSLSGKEELRATKVITFGNKTVVDGVSATVAPPDAMTYRFLGAGAEKQQLNKRREKGEVLLQEAPRILGIIPNSELGDDYLGGYYASVKYRLPGDKNDRIDQIIIQNKDPKLKSLLRTYDEIYKAAENKPDGKDYIVDDASGLLSVSHARLAEAAKQLNLTGINTSLKFKVTPVPSEDNRPRAIVSPVLVDGNGQTTQLSKEILDYLGLLDKYDLDTVTDLVKDVLYARHLKPYTFTAEDLN